MLPSSAARSADNCHGVAQRGTRARHGGCNRRRGATAGPGGPWTALAQFVTRLRLTIAPGRWTAIRTGRPRVVTKRALDIVPGRCSSWPVGRATGLGSAGIGAGPGLCPDQLLSAVSSRKKRPGLFAQSGPQEEGGYRGLFSLAGGTAPAAGLSWPAPAPRCRPGAESEHASGWQLLRPGPRRGSGIRKQPGWSTATGPGSRRR